jgi:predicted acylesterase/phospholipase RssA
MYLYSRKKYTSYLDSREGICGRPYRRYYHFIFLYVCIFCLFLAAAFADSSSVTNSPRYRFALVLSGGGARGLSQIGVLKALDEAGISPDLIVGTSMGAIVGSLYAAGFSPDSIQSFARFIDWNDIFSNSAKRNRLFVSQKSEPVNYLFEVRLNDRLEPIPPSSISRGQTFYELLGPLLAPAQFHAHLDFDSLHIPLRIVTTDLLTGNRVVLSSGSLAEAIRASCGVPLAFSPIPKDSMLLMDGGLASNIPVDVANDEHAALIVAVDVTSPLWIRDDLENPVRLMDQVVAIGVKHQKEMSKSNADLAITPVLDGFSNIDFSPVDTLVRRGYECMLPYLDTLRRLLGTHETADCRKAPVPVIQWGPADHKICSVLDSILRVMGPDSVCLERFPVQLRNAFANSGYPFGTISVIAQDSTKTTVLPDPGTIRGITVSGNAKTSSNMIRTAAGFASGEILSTAELQKAISSLYATNLFKNVNIDLDTSQKIRIMVDEKKYWRIRMGLRYDEFHLGEGFIQPAYENLFGRGICVLLHLQYGLRREKYALEFQSNHFLTANFANSVKLQTYLSTERIFADTVIVDSVAGEPDTTLWHKEKSLRKGGVLGLLGIQLGRTAMLSSGIHLEFYKVQSNVPSAFSKVWGLKFLPFALLRLTMDSMDKFPFPTAGVKTFLSIGGTSTNIGGTKDFLKFDGSVRTVFTFYRQHTVSSQIRFAWSSSPLPEVEQLYVGGSFPEETRQDMEIYNYVPFLGLSPRAMHGDVMGLAHVSYSFAIKKSVYLIAGVDWGYTWNRRNLSWNKSVDEFVRYAPVGFGAGCAFETIIGPVRCMYGRLIHDFMRKNIPADNQLYVSIGHDF